MQLHPRLVLLITFLATVPLYIFGAQEAGPKFAAEKIYTFALYCPINAQESRSLDNQIEQATNQFGLDNAFAMAADELKRRTQRTQGEIMNFSRRMKPKMRQRAIHKVVLEFCSQKPYFHQAYTQFPVTIHASKSDKSILLKIALKQPAAKEAALAKYRQIPGIEIQ